MSSKAVPALAHPQTVGYENCGKDSLSEQPPPYEAKAANNESQTSIRCPFPHHCNVAYQQFRSLDDFRHHLKNDHPSDTLQICLSIVESFKQDQTQEHQTDSEAGGSDSASSTSVVISATDRSNSECRLQQEFVGSRVERSPLPSVERPFDSDTPQTETNSFRPNISSLQAKDTSRSDTQAGQPAGLYYAPTALQGLPSHGHDNDNRVIESDSNEQHANVQRTLVDIQSPKACSERKSNSAPVPGSRELLIASQEALSKLPYRMASQPSSGAVTVADNNQTECKSRSNQNNALVLQNERSRNPFLTASAPPAATVSQVSSNGIIQLAPAQHGSKNHPSATQSHSSRQETSPSHRLRPSNARTKQTLDNAPGKDGSGGNSDEEDRNTKRQKISSSSSEDPLTRRQACPYYKRDPHTHQTSACMGPGFDTFAKLKQHINRVHSRKKYSCLRCSMSFKTHGDLQIHSKAATACHPANEPQDYLVDEQVWQTVTDRFKSTPGHNAEERWEILYHVLFPETDFIPSPYYVLTTDETILEYQRFARWYAPGVAEKLTKPDLPFRQRQAQINQLCKIFDKCHVMTYEAYMRRKAPPSLDPSLDVAQELPKTQSTSAELSHGSKQSHVTTPPVAGMGHSSVSNNPMHLMDARDPELSLPTPPDQSFSMKQSRSTAYPYNLPKGSDARLGPPHTTATSCGDTSAPMAYSRSDPSSAQLTEYPAYEVATLSNNFDQSNVYGNYIQNSDWDSVPPPILEWDETQGQHNAGVESMNPNFYSSHF